MIFFNILAILVGMNPEERSLLQRTYELVEENNKILTTLRRASRVGIAIKVFYWVVIIGLSLGSFYFIQPYIDAIKNPEGINTNVSPTNSYIDNIKSLLE